eukprot:3890262-Lingulodinium_polyedra.AAC.1
MPTAAQLSSGIGFAKRSNNQQDPLITDDRQGPAFTIAVKLHQVLARGILKLAVGNVMDARRCALSAEAGQQLQIGDQVKDLLPMVSDALKLEEAGEVAIR